MLVSQLEQAHFLVFLFVLLRTPYYFLIKRPNPLAMPEGSGYSMPAMMPPHPGLDMFSENYDDLKKKCPAFAAGCPYAKTEEFNTLAASVGDISKW
jgi:hypothetical protein